MTVENIRRSRRARTTGILVRGLVGALGFTGTGGAPPPGPSPEEDMGILVHAGRTLDGNDGYIPVGGEANTAIASAEKDVAYRAPRAMMILNGRVQVKSNTAAQPLVIILRLDDVDTLFKATIPAGVSGNIDFTGASVNIAQGKRISLFADAQAMAGGSVRYVVSYETVPS